MTPLGQRQRSYTQDDYDHWVALYEGGFSTNEVGRILDVPSGTVRSYLKRIGYEMRRPSEYEIVKTSQRDFERLRFLMYEMNMSCSDAARVLHISVTTARRWAKKGGFARTRSDAQRLAYQQGKKVAHPNFVYSSRNGTNGNRSKAELTAA